MAKVGQIKMAKVGLVKVGVSQIKIAKVGLAKVGVTVPSKSQVLREDHGPHEYLGPLLTDPPLAGQQWDFNEGRKTMFCVGILQELV